VKLDQRRADVGEAVLDDGARGAAFDVVVAPRR
jgi:hypothetical protein